MSRTGRAIERLDAWRDGRGKEHVHAWGVECEACPADTDEWDLIQELMEILDLELASHDQRTVSRVNSLLQVNLYEAPSFRADVRIDFDEHGHILSTAILPPPTPQPWPELTWPTPEDLADWLVKATPAERLRWCARLLKDALDAARCSEANHPAAMEELEARRREELNSLPCGPCQDRADRSVGCTCGRMRVEA